MYKYSKHNFSRTFSLPVTLDIALKSLNVPSADIRLLHSIRDRS